MALCFNYDLHIFHVIIIFADNKAVFIAWISCPQGTKATEWCQNRHLASMQACSFYSVFPFILTAKYSSLRRGHNKMYCRCFRMLLTLSSVSQSFVRCRVRLSKEIAGSSAVFSLSLYVFPVNYMICI